LLRACRVTEADRAHSFMTLRDRGTAVPATDPEPGIDQHKALALIRRQRLNPGMVLR